MRPLPETVIVRGGGQRRQKLMQHMLVVGDYFSEQASVGLSQKVIERRLPLLLLQDGPKNWHHILYALTLRNINRFSKLFHCQNQEKICNNTHPSTPQVCRYSTL